MANTSSGKEKDQKSKRKLKDKEKKEAVALLGGAGSKPPKVCSWLTCSDLKSCWVRFIV